MKRRHILVLGGAALAVAALAVGGRLPLVAGWINRPIRSDFGAEIDVLLMLADGAGASGEKFVSIGADAAALAGGLRARLALVAGERPDPADAARLLSSAIADDFSRGRVFEHAGWVLSETEARLARLRWLVAGKRSGGSEVDNDSPVADLVQIEDWGPKRTVQGVPFMVQPDGHLGLWFKARNAPPWIQMRIDGHEMPTFVSSDAITSGIHGQQRQLIDRAGSYRIELVDPPTGRVQHVGDLEVAVRPEPFVHADGRRSEVFCVLENWGPSETVAGVAANAQPDGSMGIWITTSCVPPDSTVMLGDVRLATSVQPDIVTARIPLALIESPGLLPVEILYFGSNERMPVGLLSVQAAE